MNIKLLIASSDEKYANHLSSVLTNSGEGLYTVEIFTQKPSFINGLTQKNYDIVLFDHDMYDGDLNFNSSKLFILLTDDETDFSFFEKFTFIRQIYKYQRISNISREMLDYYSGVADIRQLREPKTGVNVSAIFSPAGGCGKTSVAVAYALKLANGGENHKDKKRVFYLNLENFASTHAYFSNSGKSLSDVLSKIEKLNAVMLTSLKQQDPRSGISYFSMPQNYDDMNVVTEDNIIQLIDSMSAAGICDELVIDLPSAADIKTFRVLKKADGIFLVTDFTQNTRQKISQFVSQHNIFDEIQSKTTLIINKGGNDKSKIDGINKTIKLPLLNLSDGYALCESLAKILQKEMG